MRILLCMAIMLSITLSSCSPIEKTPKVHTIQTKKTYEEFPIATGISHAGHMVTLYLSLNGGTWSIVVATPNGNVGIVDMGTDWTFYFPEPETREGAL